MVERLFDNSEIRSRDSRVKKLKQKNISLGH